MTTKRIVPPAVQPIALAQAKAHLRVSSSAEDELINELISAATQLLEQETGLALISQNWRLWIDNLPADGLVELPFHPVQRITNVTWYDSEGVPQSLAGNSYFLNAISRPARMRFDRIACPAGICNGIEIDFDAGFGDIGADCPDILCRAILALIAHWYEFRGVYTPQDQPVSVPEIYTRLTRHYRQIRI